MMNSIERKKLLPTVLLFNNIKVNRFKTIRMSINLYVPLNVEDAAHNALLRGLLTRSCKAYPDFTQFSKKLSALYGTDIVSSVKKTGAYQVLTFTAVGIDDRYVFTDEIISAEISKAFCVRLSLILTLPTVNLMIMILSRNADSCLTLLTQSLTISVAMP